MTFDRTTLIVGPAVVQFNGMTFYTEGDITEKITRETNPRSLALFGKVDETLKLQFSEISFTPAGQLKTLSKYYPVTHASIGKSLLGSTDTPVVIWTLAGKKITWANGCLVKCPALRLDTGKDAFGDMTLRCISKKATELTDPAAFSAITAAALADATYDPATVRRARYTWSWGTAYAAQQHEAGIEIDVALSVENKVIANFGIVDIYLKEIVATAKLIPAGLSEADLDLILGLQDAAAVLPGQSLAKAGNDLVVTDGTNTFTLHKAGPKMGERKYGDVTSRLGQLEFMSQVGFTAGVVQPVFEFTLGS